MPIVISTGGQTRARNCYQSSAQCRLTLRVNGEDSAVVITDSGQVVPAGFPAPVNVPVAAYVALPGGVAPGYYVYRYVYASSRYPFVENAVTGGGDQWPRSSPSPASNTVHVLGNGKVTISGDYTTRSDVDFIWMYRTSVQTTQALAEAQSNAGRLFYIGRIANITTGSGTFTYTDSSTTDTAEPLELDNYECPLFWHTVFDGFQWWGWGNHTLTAVVQLDDTSTITTGVAPYGGSWGDGRNGPPSSISFLGITTGGYDGRGNFYFQALTSTTANIFNAEAMISPVVLSATGFTTAYLTAPSTTLYKSKQLNPFSWGVTQVTFIPNTAPQQTQSTPFLYAEQIGGGVGTAISLVPNERVLKLDTEAPERSYALDLNAANSSDFIGTLRTLDEANSVGSQFSQFPMRNSEGQSYGTGINAKALQIVQGDAQSQIPIGGPVITTLRDLVRTDEIPTFFHGVYDRNAELNCWWVKIDEAEDNRIDTLLYQHAPTGTWGMKHDPGVAASWTVFDPTTEEYYSFIGTDSGLVGIAFNAGSYQDYTAECDAATFFVAGSENTLTVPIYAEISSMAVDSTGFIVTVTTTTPHGLLTGAFVGFALPGTNVVIPLSVGHSIHTITASTFQITLAAPLSGTDVHPNAVIPPIWYVPSVVSFAGVGMYYIQFNSNPTAGTFSTGDDVVSYAGPSTYTLTNIYDYSNAGVLPDNVGTTYSIYAGGIPCFLRRYYTSGSPEKQKGQTELFTTLLNPNPATGAVLSKWYQNYDQTAAADRIIALAADVNESGTPSPLWYLKDVPSDLTPEIGLEISEIGNAAFEILDLTLKQSPA